MIDNVTLFRESILDFTESRPHRLLRRIAFFSWNKGASNYEPLTDENNSWQFLCPCPLCRRWISLRKKPLGGAVSVYRNGRTTLISNMALAAADRAPVSRPFYLSACWEQTAKRSTVVLTPSFA
jgi:hypothetical protein